MTEVNQSLVQLLTEQTKHNVQLFQTLAQPSNWGKAAQLQNEFLRTSWQRAAQFARRYVEVGQAAMTSALSTARDQASKRLSRPGTTASPRQPVKFGRLPDTAPCEQQLPTPHSGKNIMPAATVIATIASPKIAKQLIDELLEAGFKDQDIEILAGDEDALVAEIVERGFGQGDARDYAEAVNGGKSLVAARAPEDKVEQVSAIMERYETSTGESSPQEQGETVQEIEEELAVGKRKVASGGVRVTTSVSERPVEETVTLREEAGRGCASAGGPQADVRGGEGGLPGEDRGDARHQRGAEGQQGGTGGRRSLARQAGRGA